MAHGAFQLDPRSHQQLFESLNAMTRGFANVAAGGNASILSQLDDLLAMGWTARLQFAVGSAGALACNLELVSLEGQVQTVLSIDAPPTTEIFTFVEQGSLSSQRRATSGD